MNTYTDPFDYISNLNSKFSEGPTPIIQHIPNEIDEYVVVVKNVSDWEEVHDFIINDNEIDGIPNRNISCENIKEYSLRRSVYSMSVEESEILKNHQKVESVTLNPDKYVKNVSLDTNRYKKDVAFHKNITPMNGLKQSDSEAYEALFFDGKNIQTSNYNDSNVRVPWSFKQRLSETASPWQGVGIGTTTLAEGDIQYSLTGKNVDAVILDSGATPLHPEFIADDGTYRLRDLILDGPYYLDPDYFINNSLTQTKTIDGVTVGTTGTESASRSWWSNSSNRSTEFQSLGTVSSINSLYTSEHSQSKTSNSNNNEITDGHGTACASLLGGKTFGLAFESNLWSIRLNIGTGYISADTALDICTIFHNSKKLNSKNPTVISTSFSQGSKTENDNGVTYYTNYRGTEGSYVGTGSTFTITATSGVSGNAYAFRHYCAYGTGAVVGGSAGYARFPYPFTLDQDGLFIVPDSSINSAAEDAISSGCILVASAGNKNQKLSTYDDLDYNNFYRGTSSAGTPQYTCRVQGIQKGHSGLDTRLSGSIRVGALDSAVDPYQIATYIGGWGVMNAYGLRKIYYSSNGPMVNCWVPTNVMAAGYTSSYEDFQRSDDSNYYDGFFGGTSACSPQVASLIALYLETDKNADQKIVHEWIDSYATKDVPISDQVSNPNSIYYWSAQESDAVQSTIFNYLENTETFPYLGAGNLRGAPPKLLVNPYANNTKPSLKGVNVDSVRFKQNK
jgi:hypothetical protein